MANPVTTTRETRHLVVLFATIYFVQGVGEPTEGLIAQPVRSLLKSWGHDTAYISAFMAAMALPWALKPLYGLVSDFLPFAGYRRRSYLILTSAVTALCLLALYVAPAPHGATAYLFTFLILPTLGVAFSDVVADALMIEKGQPRGITGLLQSWQWAAMYGATVLTGVLGGYLSQHGQQTFGFAICGGLTLVTLLLAVFWVDEPRGAPRPAGSLPEAARALWRIARQPWLLAVAAYLFLWSFNPFSTTVQYVYMTEALGLSEQSYGTTISLQAIACVAASLCYGLYSRRVSLRFLLHASIALGVLSTLIYLFIVGESSARAVALAFGFVYMTATLIQLDVAARATPPEAAGTVFALLMAVSNLSLSASTWLGGDWYERGTALWGAQASYRLLVVVGAAFTACCWLLLPALRRGAAAATGPGPADHGPADPAHT